MTVGSKDRLILRELGKKVAEIAALPAQKETVSLWKALNGLRPVRPMVSIDQVCWNEMDVDGELALSAQDEFCRKLETHLRRTLYGWKHMRVDMVVEPVIPVAKVLRNSGYGIQVQEQRAVSDPQNAVVGHFYIDQFAEDGDLGKIRTPEISLDVQATAEAEEKAHGIFDGVLPVRMQGAFPAFQVWDLLTMWRGGQNVLLDLAVRPEFTHRLMARMTDAYLAGLDQMEAQGLLGDVQPTIHCAGAWTDELPAPGYDPKKPRARDLWTCGMAQIFSSVSPAMHKEFELDYAVRWYDRFGLNYYGCCEPLHDKIDIIRAIPRLRKISMSPWVDVEKGAERIGRDFVFSRKPSPAFLAVGWSPADVEKDLRATRDACARHGTPLELVLKDISTVGYKPRHLWEWADIAMRVARG